MRLADRLDERHGDDLADRRRQPRRHRPAIRRAALGDGVADRLQLGHHAHRVVEHLAAGVGDRHAAAVPLEQRDSELLLQQPDLAAERRLRDVEPVRGAAQAAELRDMDEGLELS
jgi:hypothetical protein